MNVFRPKFAAAGLPTNLRNAQLASFFNSALFLLPVGSGAKRSMPIQKLGSSSLVSHSGLIGHIGQARALCYNAQSLLLERVNK